VFINSLKKDDLKKKGQNLGHTEFKNEQLSKSGALFHFQLKREVTK